MLRRVGILLLCLAAPAVAQDSLAPPGASSGWLPAQKWVLRHWVPFDEAALLTELGLGDRDLESYLYNDHRTLAMIAAQRGIAVDDLADRLLAPWGTGVTADLRDHTVRLLTQGHLAQHVFFHVFHGMDAYGQAATVFGLTPHQYQHLRLHARTPLQIAAAGGVSRAHVVAGLRRLLRRDRDEGLRRGLSWPAEAERLYQRQLALLPCWLRRPLARFDAGNPYGKEWRHHDSAEPPEDRSHAEERHDENVIAGVLADLPASCWTPPLPWSWTAHGLLAPWGG